MILLQIQKEIGRMLTPKGPRGVFLQKRSNLPFLAQEAQMNFFSLFCTLNQRILY
jgi:hypothetical protein